MCTRRRAIPSPRPVATGQLLWQTKLPYAGYATPSVYRVDGKQYVVIAAGGGKLETPSGVTTSRSHFRMPSRDSSAAARRRLLARSAAPLVEVPSPRGLKTASPPCGTPNRQANSTQMQHTPGEVSWPMMPRMAARYSVMSKWP
jgi:hypothetical protein